MPIKTYPFKVWKAFLADEPDLYWTIPCTVACSVGCWNLRSDRSRKNRTSPNCLTNMEKCCSVYSEGRLVIITVSSGELIVNSKIGKDISGNRLESTDKAVNNTITKWTLLVFALDYFMICNTIVSSSLIIQRLLLIGTFSVFLGKKTDWKGAGSEGTDCIQWQIRRLVG